MYFLLTGCQNPNVLRIIYFIEKILNLAFTIIPIGLIIFITIDIVKIIISADDKAIRENHKSIINRIIFAIAMFFVPTLVGLVMGLLNTFGFDTLFNTDNQDNYALCIKNATKENIAIYQIIQDEEDASNEARIQLELQNRLNQDSNTYNDTQRAGSGSNNNSGNNNSSNNSNNNYTSGNEATGDIYQRLAAEMLKVAINEIGETEGTNNDNKYGRELGANNLAWCGIFVKWVELHTTIDGINLYNDIINKEGNIINPYSAINPIYTFSVSSNLTFYTRDSGYIPKMGDIIFLDRDWNGKISPSMYSSSGHVAIVKGVDSENVYSIDGNSGAGATCVAENKRLLTASNIVGYGSWYQ